MRKSWRRCLARLVLTGFGNVNQALLRILDSQADLLSERYDLTPAVVGVSDSSGAVYDQSGLDFRALLAHKRSGAPVAAFTGAKSATDSQALIDAVHADYLMEATPTNLQTGQPGLGVTHQAFDRGMHAILASKGPLVLDYAGLIDHARRAGKELRFSAAVGGALTTINSGRRDLAGARITRFEGVLNGTTQIILGMMARGASFEAALDQARAVGITETDPSLDIDGWDAANKLVIVANAVLGRPASLKDVDVTGIRDIEQATLLEASKAGGRVSLLATAVPNPDGRYVLRVAPAELSAEHPLARLGDEEMGAVYETDIYGRLVIAVADQGPLGTAAAMLRDLIDIEGRR